MNDFMDDFGMDDLGKDDFVSDDFGVSGDFDEGVSDGDSVDARHDDVVDRASGVFGGSLRAWQVGLLLGALCVGVVIFILVVVNFVNGGFRIETKGSSSGTASTGSTGVVSSGVSLVDVPVGTNVEYKGVVKVNGVISGKSLYLDSVSGQVYYLLRVDVSGGGRSFTMSHFCSKSVYDSVVEGVSVVVQYNQIEGGYYSVHSLSLSAEN